MKVGRDFKAGLAIILVLGFIGLIAMMILTEIPGENVKSVDGAMAALGTAVGAAVMALMRNSHADEVKAENTGRAFDAIHAVAKDSFVPGSNTIKDGDTVTMHRDADPPSDPDWVKGA